MQFVARKHIHTLWAHLKTGETNATEIGKGKGGKGEKRKFCALFLVYFRNIIHIQI